MMELGLGGLGIYGAGWRGGGVSLPASTLAAWDASVLASLYQDTGGATPVTAADDPVGLWKDQQGSYDLSQATIAARPLYQTGQPRLVFDGVDDHLFAATRLGLAANPAMAVVVALTPKVTGVNDVRVFDLGNSAGVLSCSFGTDGWAWRHNNGNRIFGSVTFGQTVVATWFRAAGSTYGDGRFRLNGVEQAATSTANPVLVPTSTAAELRVGENVTVAGGYTPMDLYTEVVLGTDSLTDIAQAEAWAAARAGVTL
ncbi:hypothetical protein CKO11_14910 [Rhodobacter sp. TJ_12]|uniref:hypothetical protein n=1 Tax=Rhodobacter sp. TJ_12 TaxID=2029399 RepID=UPI001CBA7635|nr:hypothetical protein [Rhodobacter sp. TJ_12]MBZ4023742.1 hypothetical protein [Rhodobacter sp. TJ_12]